MAVNQLIVAGRDVSVLLPGKGHHVFGGVTQMAGHVKGSLSSSGSCEERGGGVV